MCVCVVIQALASGEKRSWSVQRSVSVGVSPERSTNSTPPGARGEGDREDGEETLVPSFKDAFSEALLSASQSVMAATRGTYHSTMTLTT